MSIYKTYWFQYINNHEHDVGFELEHGEMVSIRAFNEPRAWDEFEAWSRLKEERVELVEIVEVDHDE